MLSPFSSQPIGKMLRLARYCTKQKHYHSGNASVNNLKIYHPKFVETSPPPIDNALEGLGNVGQRLMAHSWHVWGQSDLLSMTPFVPDQNIATRCRSMGVQHCTGRTADVLSKGVLMSR